MKTPIRDAVQRTGFTLVCKKMTQLKLLVISYIVILPNQMMYPEGSI